MRPWGRPPGGRSPRRPMGHRRRRDRPRRLRPRFRLSYAGCFQFFKELLFFVAQLFRQAGLDAGVEVATGAAAVELRHTQAAETEGTAVLRQRRQLQRDLLVHALDLDFTPEDGHGQRGFDVDVEVIALALEAGVGLHADDEVEISALAVEAHATFAGHADARPVSDAGRNLYFDATRTGTIDLSRQQPRRALECLLEGDVDALLEREVLAPGLLSSTAATSSAEHAAEHLADFTEVAEVALELHAPSGAIA